MTRQEFLNGLERSLSGEVSEAERRSNLQYYQEYITGEVQKGRTETDVLEELGDPRLIARSIIDAEAAAEERHGIYRGEGSLYEDAQGEDPGYRQEGTGGRVMFFSGWRATLAVILVIVVLLGILSLLFSAAFAILRSPVFWVILLGWMVWRVLQDRRGGGW